LPVKFSLLEADGEAFIPGENFHVKFIFSGYSNLMYVSHKLMKCA